MTENSKKQMTGYSIEDIKAIYYDNSIDDKDLIKETTPQFNTILQKADELAGKKQYKIHSIYTVDFSKYTSSNSQMSYVIKIVPDKYKNEFENWNGSENQNPYLVMFTKRDNREIVDNYYDTLLLGLTYEKEINEEFTNLNTEYKMSIFYNYFFYISSQNIGMQKNDNWDNTLKRLSFLTNDMNSINIFMPYGYTKEQINEYLKTQKEFFRKYYIKYVTVCILHKEISLNKTDVTHLNQYSSKIIDKYYNYAVDQYGDIKK